MTSPSRITAAAALIACSLLPAQDQQQEQGRAGSTVHLRVVDDKGGPVQRCRVRLLSAKDAAAAAAGRFGKVPRFVARQLHPRDFEDGWCALQELPVGRFVICCEAELYANAVSSPFSVPTDGRIAVTVTLPRGAVVAGKVVDGSGQPVAGAAITIGPRLPIELAQPTPFATLLDNLLDTPLTRVEVRTDDEGKYRIEHVARGSYQVTVRHPGFCVLRQEVEVSADDRDLENLALAAGCLVHGKVKGGSDTFVVLLSGQGPDGAESLRAKVDADGAFRFAERVPPGEWQVATNDAQAKDPFARVLQLKATTRLLIIAPGQAEADIELEPPAAR